MTEIPSIAWEMFQAFNSKFDWVEDGVPGPQFDAIAAALKVAADRVVPFEKELEGNRATRIAWKQRMLTRAQLHAIALQLEEMSCR